MNQLKIRLPEFRENQNPKSRNPQIQSPIKEYNKNAIMDYRRSIDLATSSQEQYKQCQLGYQNDLQRIETGRNSPQGSPTSVTSSLDSCNRGMTNNAGQIIAVPTQPMSSSQGYTMKIEVSAQPLKTQVEGSDKPNENCRDEYEATDFTRRKPVDIPQNILQPDRQSECLVPVCAGPVPSTKSIICTKKKKKMSIFSKIVRRIRRENSAHLGVNVCEKQQIYSEGNSKSEASAELVKVLLSSRTELQNRDGGSMTSSLRNEKNNTNNGVKESQRNEVYVAQEILSPRQMISSTTNICSAKTEVQSTEPGDSVTKITSSGRKEVTLTGEEGGNVASSFQDVVTKLEDTLAK